MGSAAAPVSTSDDYGGVRKLGALLGLTALVTLGCAAAGVAFSGTKMPVALIYANLGAAMFDLLVAWGLVRTQRAGWAFGVAIWGMLIVVNLLGAAHFGRSGSVGLVSLGLVVWRFGLGIALLAVRRPMA